MIGVGNEMFVIVLFTLDVDVHPKSDPPTGAQLVIVHNSSISVELLDERIHIGIRTRRYVYATEF